MHIALGCDHRGFDLKQVIMDFITDMGHSCKDFGCYDTTPSDYPDIAQAVARAVAGEEFDYGILVCNTGIGMSIVANKIKGIRAALCHNPLAARLARQHNDANVLCLGGGVVKYDLVREIVTVFLNTGFEGGRHARRLEKIRIIEAGI